MDDRFKTVPKLFTATWNSRKTAVKIQMPEHEEINAGDMYECLLRKDLTGNVQIIYTKKENKKNGNKKNARRFSKN